MKNKKISLAAGIAFCALTILFTILYAALAGAFVRAAFVPPCDIADSFAKEEIIGVCEKGYMRTQTIRESVYFYPLREVSRGELAQILTAFLSLDTTPYQQFSLGFGDEAEMDLEFLPYVRAVLANGYMSLEYDYCFHADHPISREEAAYIFGALCSASISTGKSESFSDFYDTHPYFEARTRKIIDFEIMIGYPDGTFRPKQSLSREELALILHRLEAADHFKKPQRNSK